MPRKNRTFSSQDVVRIFEKNLTQSEKSSVIKRLCEKRPPEEAEEAIDVLIDALEVILTLVEVIELFYKPAKALVAIIELALISAHFLKRVFAD